MSDKPEFKPYTHPAGGWGAANATARVLMEQSVLAKGSRALLAMNHPDGFKCPSCAWPDPDREKTLEFCENGAKALAFEATKRKVGADFFATHTVTDLMSRSDHWLEEQGRLTQPMRYDAATDHYVPCTWDEAYAMIGRHLRALDHPDQAEFYTSGRTSNEAAFLYSVFVRAFGTNNFPDCSNMCHEPTSRGLPMSIGIGKGTVQMKDFAHAEAIFIIGQNTGTNSPRMMTELVHARKRGAPIVAVNPMPERALIRFTEPQDPIKMATFGSTPIASEFCHVRIGGDVAFLKGVMKTLFQMDEDAAAKGEPAVLDHTFITEHTDGFAALKADIEATRWPDIVATSGLSEEQIRRVAGIYAASNATIICFGMGVTQHQQGSRVIHQIANLLMLRGNFGKDGAGICPVRGHSNVQGDRTVGIDEKPTSIYLDRLQAAFGFSPPREHGHHVIESVQAMIDGTARVFIGMGGNFIHAIPDTPVAYEAMARLDLTVGIATKLNRGHLVHGRDALILPVIARSEIDMQKTGPQFVTIEDAMSGVTRSHGVLHPASADLRSEIEIVCRMARATLPDSTIDWEGFVDDYDLIRDTIAQVYPDLYADFNTRIRQGKGFSLPVPPRQRIWNTPTGKANFLLFDGLDEDTPIGGPDMLRLSTIRSHDQYNTTVYTNNDRYRGVYNTRMVVFMNKDDMAARGLVDGAMADLETISTDGTQRRVDGLMVVPYPMPRGSIAGYYPELNPLLPLSHFDQIAGTPAAKSIPVRVTAAAPAAQPEPA
ncbi:FdhF/YdeP family oxidoreductase [Komagataeibacter oboediens]|uniref:FdhF/YdeP family oxidoreductase n=1 Tax=Komagataeibacter oboediens TaxID=65958 RepID=A0ABS5SMJ0_9PROT|nr:FdhF/YdeP family oxidoreductase [Komagataeibacter oboediens]MBL7233196.1 FdhF/YdeP family oxidoreductase [Komagataeibacter oboediens]MBT0675480.1 FdhF/YdeP family oxidoreductase [Komagataeibacter oboediens]MBT0679727.1 FdhF/YdeP family oxidoreductase [Komagataeibacter oboediens]